MARIEQRPELARRRSPRARVLGVVGLGLALTALAWTWRIGRSPVLSSASTGPAGRFDNDEARTLGRSVDDLQRRLRSHPKDWQAWTSLGFAYLEDARVAADPALYPKAEGAFARSLELNPTDNFAAPAGRGALANARHDFAGGLKWGKRAMSLNPESPEVHAVMGDALVELGRYEEGFVAYQRMVDLAPGLASYTRAAYALELQGDVAGARRTLQLALGEVRAPKDRAFAHFSLAELAWNTGDSEEARRRYEESVELDPAFMAPLAGLARLHAATGAIPQALADWHDVLLRAPLPEYVGELGNLYKVNGQPAEAQRQFDLLEAQRRLLAANGVNGDLELALFSADHQVGLADGLAVARGEWSRRQSIHVADALAWQLHAHGRHAEALQMADQALRLGTRNALFHFHRGMIQRALGNDRAARADLEQAMVINPHFSILHAPTATRALADFDAP